MEIFDEKILIPDCMMNPYAYRDLLLQHSHYRTRQQDKIKLVEIYEFKVCHATHVQ